ncbi:MAG: serine protease, partial [Deltaproteobacteria bacterium]|nr:serine protease [Deltaproteobacteria bacterium]
MRPFALLALPALLAAPLVRADEPAPQGTTTTAEPATTTAPTTTAPT